LGGEKDEKDWKNANMSSEKTVTRAGGRIARLFNYRKDRRGDGEV